MRKKTITIGLGLFIYLLAIQANAASRADVGASIANGIAWLAGQQNSDGSWGDAEKVGCTAFAVVKLEDRALELGMSPFDEGYVHSQKVIGGLNYLFGQAGTYGDGTGTCFGKGRHVNYNTGLVMMAIAAGRDPNRIVSVPGSIVHGWTYKQVLQANVDFFATFQKDDGGWQYEPYDPTGFSDNSITGYVVLGLAYARESIYGFNCTILDSVKEKLNRWVDHIQVSGGDHDGGSGYGGGNTSDMLRAGNLIFEMAFLGDTRDTPRMQRALNYLGRAWNDPAWSWDDIHSYPGWYGNPAWNGEPYLPKSDWWQGLDERYGGWQGPHYQAMYCMMKGLTYAGIDTINVDGIDVNWYDAFATRITFGQNDDGSWDRDYWGDEILATEWALLTLEAIAPPGPVIDVSIDIKPGSLPNSINLKSEGVIPVAILTTDLLDAATVDPASITFGLTGTEATLLKFAMQDIDGDGDTDIILHFKTKATGIVCGTTAAYLKGRTVNEQAIQGSDSVRTVGCK